MKNANKLIDKMWWWRMIDVRLGCFIQWMIIIIIIDW